MSPSHFYALSWPLQKSLLGNEGELVGKRYSISGRLVNLYCIYDFYVEVLFDKDCRCFDRLRVMDSADSDDYLTDVNLPDDLI
ncbi:hypothetical protein [Fulvitalea axinellae]